VSGGKGGRERGEAREKSIPENPFFCKKGFPGPLPKNSIRLAGGAPLQAAPHQRARIQPFSEVVSDRRLGATAG